MLGCCVGEEDVGMTMIGGLGSGHPQCTGLAHCCKVWEGAAPIFNFLIYVCFVTEGVAAIGGSTAEAFVVLRIPLIRDFGARLKKWHGGAKSLMV
jgi:hypothetical protein